MSAALGYHKVSSSIYTLTASLFQQYTDQHIPPCRAIGTSEDVRRQHAQIPISDIRKTIDDVAFLMDSTYCRRNAKMEVSDAHCLGGRNRERRSQGFMSNGMFTLLQF
ncbi:hypothetical protein B0H14DRAFT_3864381 [Mycena olivaceomarginata]|nr:hypothetical protein B0H14DRAFT_3864381 [Mycena olivaceomarginata]